MRLKEIKENVINLKLCFNTNVSNQAQAEFCLKRFIKKLSKSLNLDEYKFSVFLKQNEVGGGFFFDLYIFGLDDAEIITKSWTFGSVYKSKVVKAQYA